MKQHYLKLLVSALMLTGTGLLNFAFGQLIKTTPSTTALVGTQYVYDVNVFPVGDSAFFLDQKLEGMVIDADNGRITWTPTSLDQGGMVVVRTTVGSFSDQQTFYIYVSDAVICDDAMVSYWKLDETSGTTFADFKGGYDAITSVAPEDTVGVVDVGQIFNSALDQRLSVADNAGQYDWVAGGDISVSLWFKSNLDLNTQIGPQVFIGRLGSSGSTTSKHWWWFGLDTNNYVTLNVTNIGTLAETDPNYPNLIDARSPAGVHYQDNEWHHAVFTLEGDATNYYTTKIYVDGELKKTVYKQLQSGDFTTTADLNIGWWQNPWTGKYFEFDGGMDEVAFYTRTLSASEITQIFNDGVDGKAYCQPGNYAPIFKTQPVTSATEDAVYTYNVEVDDYDAGDALTITLESAPDWLSSFTDNGNGTAVLSGTPRNGDVGNNSVILRVTDSKVNIDQEFVIAVANTNDAPVFTSSAVSSTNEDEVYTYNITAEDVDAGASMTISSVNALPAWLSLTDNGNGTGVLTGTPQNADVTTVNITLRVTDNTAAYSDQSFALVVNNVNDAPVINGQADLSTNEDENLVLSLTNLNVTDVDNNYPADFSLEISAGDHYTFSGLTVTPETNFNGTLTVNIALSDLETTVNGTVTINVVAVNDLPEITSTPVTDATAGTQYQYWVGASDVEDQVLTFEAVTIPSWATFTYNTTLKLGLLQGTPATTDAATANVSIKVTDSDGGSDTQDFIINVAGATSADDGIISNEGLLVYPTPVKDILYVKAGTDLSAGTFQILSLSGAVIRQVTIQNKAIADIDLAGLNSGVYLYRFTSNGKLLTGKFTKE